MDIDMDIKELEAFVYVVENCSFSRAAELLHLTQPTISSHISALERKLGIKLVVRSLTDKRIHMYWIYGLCIGMFFHDTTYSSKHLMHWPAEVFPPMCGY